MLAVIASGCGGGAKTTPKLASGSATECLTSAGFRVSGGPVPRSARGDSGVIRELVVEGAFIAYYPSVAVATHAAERLARNARRLRGSLVRRGRVAVLFAGERISPPQRRLLLDCVGMTGPRSSVRAR